MMYGNEAVKSWRVATMTNKPSEQTLEEMIATFEIYGFSNVPRENLDGLIAALTEWKDKEVVKELEAAIHDCKGWPCATCKQIRDRIASLTKGNHEGV